MRRAVRLLGTLLIVGGALTLGWALLVWQWQDPFTALYTHFQQERLASQLDRRIASYHAVRVRGRPLAAVRRAVAEEAAAYRRTLHRGDPIGRLTIGRIGLHIVVVQGTDHDSLTKGPGHYVDSYLPGQGELIYIAGHRTTYLAPFSDIDHIRRGDWITLQMPYGTFKYVVTGHRIVTATDLSVLRSRGSEVLVLQACHPRFFATHRYLVYARPAWISLRDGSSFTVAGTRLAAAGPTRTS